jgi:hypothetical protein
MSNIIAPTDNRFVKKSPELFTNLWKNQDFEVGNLDVSGDLNATGNINATGDINASGDIDVSGNITLAKDLNTQNAFVNSNLNVTGTTSLTTAFVSTGIGFDSVALLNSYQTFTQVFNMTGASTFNVVGRFTKIGRMVCFELLPFALQNLTSSAFITSNIAIPFDSRPANNTFVGGTMLVAGLPQPVSIEIRNDGSIQLARNVIVGSSVIYNSFLAGTTLQSDRVCSSCYTV